MEICKRVAIADIATNYGSTNFEVTERVIKSHKIQAVQCASAVWRCLKKLWAIQLYRNSLRTF